MDVMEIDAASNRGIDDVRSLRESVRYVPVMGKYKVYIIDEVHMLTPEAFNALLKTIEEPPGHVIFIMATTAPHKIPVTITSRCQRLDFRRLSVADIEGQLEKIVSSAGDPNASAEAEEAGIAWEPNALRLIARAAQGSMRDALSILDLCLTYGENCITEKDVRDVLGETGPEVMMRMFRAISQRDFREILEITRELSDRGKDMGELADEMGVFARDLLLLRSGGKPADLGRPKDETDQMLVLARALSSRMLVSSLDALARSAGDMRGSDDPRLVLEVSLLGLFLGEGPEISSAEATVPQKAIAEGAALQKVIAEGAPSHKAPPEKAPPEKPADPPVAVPVRVPSSDDPLKQVKAIWPELLDHMQRRREVLVRAYLVHASPTRIEGDNRLVLAFPPGYTTLAEQVSSKQNKEVVERFLKELTGISFDVAAETAELGSNGEVDGNDGGDGGDLHPLVKAAISMVNGKVVD